MNRAKKRYVYNKTSKMYADRILVKKERRKQYDITNIVQ